MKKYLLIMTFILLGIILSGCNDSWSNQDTAQDNINIVDTQAIEPQIESDINDTIQDDSIQAQETLISFFAYLSNQDFENALTLFELNEADNIWERLKDFSLPEDRNDKEKILQNYCQAIGTCLPANVIQIQKEDNDTYNLLVQFQNPDTSIFVLGPCCGATEEEMPSQDKFEFKVKKINGTFKVATPPIYRP